MQRAASIIKGFNVMFYKNYIFRNACFKTFLCLSLLGVAHAQGFAQGNKGLVPTDYFNFVFVSDPQMSPDGSRILLVKTTVKEDASGRNRHIYVIDRDQAPQRFTQGDNDRSPRWSPDGKSIAFVRTLDDNAQVFIMPANGGEAQQATNLTQSMSSFAWFSDSQRLLLTLATSPQDTQSEQEEDKLSKRVKPDIVVVKDAMYIANGRDYLDDKRDHLYTFRLADKTLTQLTSGADHNISNPQLSANGDYIVYSANKTGLAYDGDRNEDLYRLDIATQKTEMLTSHPHAQFQPRLSNNNKTIAYLHTEAVYEQTDLWMMSNDGSEPKNLTEKFDRFASPPVWGAKDDKLYFLANDKGVVRLFAADLKTTQVRRVLSENMTIDQFTLSPDGKSALFTMEDSTHLPELFKYNIANKKLTQITYFNSELLSNVALSPAVEVWFKNKNDMDVQGFLHKPINYVEGEKYPLILNIKGGPGGMWGHRWFHENQMYAAKGYAVAYVNYSGSNGYGIAHSKAVRLDYGGIDYTDNIEFLDTVLAQNSWIDSSKLYLTGGSHGGFLTNWITTQTTRFRAAVTQRSVSSWISEAGTQEFTPSAMRIEFGGTLWENFDYYWNRSPLQFANKVRTPTLIIHSDRDMITPIGQGQEWFYALKANNVPTEMVIFKGENHSLSRSGKPSNLVERIDRILEWFEQYSQE